MPLFEENIQNWIINETSGLSEGRLKKLPNIPSISRLTEGKNNEIWKFVIKHVKSKQSVAFTRKILEIRRSVKEREEYPDSGKDHYVILKNKVDFAGDKVRFIGHSVESITKHVYSLDNLVKSKREENCILHQKCTLLELATLDYKERNESLNVIIYKLYALLNKSFANEKTKCFINPVDRKSSKITASKMNCCDDNIKNIINEITLIVNQKLLGELSSSPVTNLVAPVTEVMSYALAIDFVNLLKHISQQDLSLLQNNVEKVKQEDVETLSETYLQSMKQDLLDSCFQRKKMEYTACSVEIAGEHFNKDIGKLQKDYFSLHIQNECLADSIQYLEKQLTIELNLTSNLKANNTKQKSQCQDIEMIMSDFYKKLKALHVLFDGMPQSFSIIKFSLESCRMFIGTQLLSTIKSSNNDDCLINVVNKIDDNYKLYLELLKAKEFLQDFLKDFTFMKLDFPTKVWEFLGLKPFQNRHLLIEKLTFIRTKLSIEPNPFCSKQEEILTSIAKQMVSSIEDNTDKLEEVKKKLSEVRKSCKDLKTVLQDWWNQDAQYIPAIVHHQKTLSMWLAILNVLE